MLFKICKIMSRSLTGIFCCRKVERLYISGMGVSAIQESRECFFGLLKISNRTESEDLHMKNIFLVPDNSAQKERRKSKKKTLKGILMGCMAVVGLLIAEPQETKAVTTSDVYWNGSTAYVATQAGLNAACDRNMTADIYLLNDITLL